MMRALLFALILISGGSASARAQLRFGITSTVAGWTDPAAAQASARPLLQLIAAEAGVSVHLETGLSAADLLAKLRSGELNSGTAVAEDYLTLAKQIKVVPVLRAIAMRSSTHRLLLMVDRGAGISRPGQLAGKSVAIYGTERLHRIYLETLIAREKIQELSIDEKKDNRSPVLAVLFREASGCIVSDRVFQVMAELNPQLKKRLAVIASSAPLAWSPLFFRADLDPKLIAAVLRNATQIHTHERGRQLLLLFRITQLIKARSEDYQSVRELISEHERLTRKRASR